jgi:beta-lactamase regulating signal transducer with metallopeptidase domain
VANELALLLIRLNLSLGAAVILVLLLRGPIRRWSGADLAYNLWILPPLAVGGDLLALSLSMLEDGHVGRWLPSLTLPSLPSWFIPLWFAGATAGILLMAATHVAALVRMRRGTLGPAVIGLVRPRLCLPADFTDRFTPVEQRLIRAHERVHMERNDVLANVLMGVLRSTLWFNPLVHIAAAAMKQDQELACDAAVMDVFPDQRRRYAAAMLKAGVGPAGVCAFGSHPLSIRITAIVRGGPLPHPRVVGIVVLGVVAFAIVAVYASSFGEKAAQVYLGPYAADQYRQLEQSAAKPAWLQLRP